MSATAPTEPVFIVDSTIAIRAASERDALNEIARRLKAMGPDRDAACELRFPRTMTPSTPLFSAIEWDRDAAREEAADVYVVLARLRNLAAAEPMPPVSPETVRDALHVIESQEKDLAHFRKLVAVANEMKDAIQERDRGTMGPA